MNSMKVEADSMARENEKEIAAEMNLSGQFLPCWSRAERASSAGTEGSKMIQI